MQRQFGVDWGWELVLYCYYIFVFICMHIFVLFISFYLFIHVLYKIFFLYVNFMYIIFQYCFLFIDILLFLFFLQNLICILYIIGERSEPPLLASGASLPSLLNYPNFPYIYIYIYIYYRRAERAPHLSYSGEKFSSYIYICFLYIYIYIYVRTSCTRALRANVGPAG